MGCEFCELLQRIKDDVEYHKNKRKNESYSDEYKISLVHESYYNGEYTGRCSYGNFGIRFCPVCGKEYQQK